MGQKGMDFKHKEVINVKDGKRLGFVQDVCADLETGTITSIIVPGSNKILSMFSASNDIVIQWQNIKCIGDDVILVEIWKMKPIKEKNIEQNITTFYKKVVALSMKILTITKKYKKLQKSLDFIKMIWYYKYSYYLSKKIT